MQSKARTSVTNRGGDLRLYKNFFQPVMKLIGKERIGRRVMRKYATLKMPYQRLMDPGQISEQTRKHYVLGSQAMILGFYLTS